MLDTFLQWGLTVGIVYALAQMILFAVCIVPLIILAPFGFIADLITAIEEYKSK